MQGRNSLTDLDHQESGRDPTSWAGGAISRGRLDPRRAWRGLAAPPGAGVAAALPCHWDRHRPDRRLFPAPDLDDPCLSHTSIRYRDAGMLRFSRHIRVNPRPLAFVTLEDEG